MAPYLVLIDVDVAKMGVVHQFARLDVDRGLAAASLAHVPVGVD